MHPTPTTPLTNVTLHDRLVWCVVSAVERLQALGYDLELRAAPGGRLHCPACHAVVDASIAVVDETFGSKVTPTPRTSRCWSL